MNDSLKSRPRVLIIDDERAIRHLLSEMLSDEYDCVMSESAEIGLEECEKATFDLVISDINLGGMSGVEMVPCIRKVAPDTVVMMISGAQNVDAPIEAMRVGVFDYLRKPFDFDQVLTAVRRAIGHRETLVAKRRQEIELASLFAQKTSELHHVTHHDVLTNLPNETAFENHLESIISDCDINQQAAVMLVSIANLGTVRDSIGLAAANEILVDASARLKPLAEKNMLARFEGGKFALLVSPIEPDQALEVSNKIFQALKPTFSTGANEIHVHLNIGISIFPHDGTESHTLIRNAGAALSQAEATGTAYKFYAAEMNARAVRQLALENCLQGALERGEFTVFYQPKVDTRSRRIVGMEALLRWNSEELGPVPPDIFIPVAESTGLITPIGEWVLRAACVQAKSWQTEGFSLNLSVNLSARQLRDRNLPKRIWTILQDSGLDPDFLELEVTETSLVENPDIAVEILTQLQKLGISISIDDFGTGHSSLGYLRALPIDVLKIDKSFIKNISTEPDAATLVKTMITLAHDLRLRVIAEGVETEEQLDVLNSLGCDEWQGYLRSRPLPPDQFIQELKIEPA